VGPRPEAQMDLLNRDDPLFLFAQKLMANVADGSETPVREVANVCSCSNSDQIAALLEVT